MVSRLAREPGGVRCGLCGTFHADEDGIVRILPGQEAQDVLPFVETWLPAVFALSHWPESIAGGPVLPDLTDNLRTLDRLAGWATPSARTG